jgi:hypothetical protein
VKKTEKRWGVLHKKDTLVQIEEHKRDAERIAKFLRRLNHRSLRVVPVTVTYPIPAPRRAKKGRK